MNFDRLWSPGGLAEISSATKGPTSAVLSSGAAATSRRSPSADESVAICTSSPRRRSLCCSSSLGASQRHAGHMDEAFVPGGRALSPGEHVRHPDRMATCPARLPGRLHANRDVAGTLLQAPVLQNRDGDARRADPQRDPEEDQDCPDHWSPPFARGTRRRVVVNLSFDAQPIRPIRHASSIAPALLPRPRSRANHLGDSGSHQAERVTARGTGCRGVSGQPPSFTRDPISGAYQIYERGERPATPDECSGLNGLPCGGGLSAPGEASAYSAADWLFSTIFRTVS